MRNGDALPSKKCKLSTCREEFIPATVWQEFHTVKCRQKYHSLEHKRGVQMLRESKVRI